MDTRTVGPQSFGAPQVGAIQVSVVRQFAGSEGACVEGLGGFVVEASAALSILLYLAFLWLSGRWNQKFSIPGFNYSVLTGICVGAGTIAFFLLFQKGGPLSSVPAILAGGAAIMAIAGILFFHEPPSWQRLLGVAFAIVGLFLLRH